MVYKLKRTGKRASAEANSMENGAGDSGEAGSGLERDLRY